MSNYFKGGFNMEESLIIDYEERLREAMLIGDVNSLDNLINDNLIFVNHFGQILTKEADIEAHRSGVLNFTDIKILDPKSDSIRKFCCNCNTCCFKRDVWYRAN